VATPHPNDVQEALLAIRRGANETERAALRRRLRNYFATLAPELAREQAEIHRLKREVPRHPTTLVFAERPPGHQRITHVHRRGEFLDPADPVQPGVPEFLPDLPQDAPRNRLSLARWLVSPANPLTARVTINREWETFFGRGLVRTLEDFGLQGELPTHPELLDWLAVEFIQRNWSLKEMHRLIVLSATYQQSSRVTPERLELDPQNVWLSRGPRLRLEAELVRDAALVASGLLAPQVGGPSVFPPQLSSITTEGTYGPLTWNVSEGPDRYRRGLYTFAKRTAPFALFQAFDAPSGEACLARRDRSNTPLQALTLLNDSMFVEFAQALGQQTAGADGSVEDRARWLFRRCLTRPPQPDELDRLVDFYRRQAARYGSGELQPAPLLNAKTDDARIAEAAAWTALARVLLNVDEALTRS
jgi:hypothetical protein